MDNIGKNNSGNGESCEVKQNLEMTASTRNSDVNSSDSGESQEVKERTESTCSSDGNISEKTDSICLDTLGANADNIKKLECTVKYLVTAVSQLKSIVEKKKTQADSITNNLQEYENCLSTCETIMGDPIVEATERSLKRISAAVEEGIQKIFSSAVERAFEMEGGAFPDDGDEKDKDIVNAVIFEDEELGMKYIKERSRWSENSVDPGKPFSQKFVTSMLHDRENSGKESIAFRASVLNDSASSLGNSALYGSVCSRKPSTITFAASRIKKSANNGKGSTTASTISGKSTIGTSAIIPARDKKRMLESRRLSSRRFGILKKRDDIPMHSADCYSFLAVHTPFTSPCFWFGIMVFSFQMIFLVFILLLAINRGQVDNPAININEGGLSLLLSNLAPANVDGQVRTVQCVAVLCSVVFADAPFMDCFLAIEQIPHYHQRKKGIRIWQVWMACFFRFLQGFLATMTSLILIMNTDNGLEIVLNFTAVNFISTLDNTAFELAKAGHFGHKLEKRAALIGNSPIRYRGYKFTVLQCHLITMVVLGFSMLGVFTGVIYLQESPNHWRTPMYRVEFQGSDMEHFNGCYQQTGKQAYGQGRLQYNSYQFEDQENGIFGYCKKTHKWVLFEVDSNYTADTDPCTVAENNVRARSSETFQYDISSSFEDTWYSVTGSSIDVSFLNDIKIDICTAFENNGKCDEVFNNYGNEFDGGDCCSSTCDNEGCGMEGADGAFGIEGLKGIAFRECKDPKMIKLKIVIDNIVSSREQYRGRDEVDEDFYFEEKKVRYWEETPSATFLQIRCDDKDVLEVYFDESFDGGTETIWVGDGAKCDFNVNNSTLSTEKWDNEPFWLARYGIYAFSGDTVITGSSATIARQSFKLIPSCYLEKLESYFDQSLLYLSSPDSIQALRWVSDGDGKAPCNKKVVERFALAALNYAAPGKRSDQLWIKNGDHCIWDDVICREGHVEKFGVRRKSLDGTISTMIGLLTELKQLLYDENGLRGTIPTELGNLKKLTNLDVDKNKLTGTIPSELGMLTDLIELDIEKNKLTGTIPTEFFRMTKLFSIEAHHNKLSGPIPSEVQKLTDVGIFQFHDNKLTGTFPIELTMLKNVTKLLLSNNNLEGTIPTEIGLLTSLVEIELAGNSFTGEIPSEIGSLKKLKTITLDRNNFVGTIPSQITSLDKLESLTRDNFIIGSVPDHIASLVSCRLCDGQDYKVVVEEDCREILNNLERKLPISRKECTFLRESCVTCSTKTTVPSTEPIDASSVFRTDEAD